MKKAPYFCLKFLVILSMSLAACQPAPQVTVTSEVTVTSTPSPTKTPLPTETSIPTLTPTPTPVTYTLEQLREMSVADRLALAPGWDQIELPPGYEPLWESL